jgi:hypothetical protein
LSAMNKKGRVFGPCLFLLIAALWVLFAEPPILPAAGGYREFRAGEAGRCRYFWAAAFRSIKAIKSGSMPYPRLLAFFKSGRASRYFSWLW